MNDQIFFTMPRLETKDSLSACILISSFFFLCHPRAMTFALNYKLVVHPAIVYNYTIAEEQLKHRYQVNVRNKKHAADSSCFSSYGKTAGPIDSHMNLLVRLLRR